jgi:hypothetical protein
LLSGLLYSRKYAYISPRPRQKTDVGHAAEAALHTTNAQRQKEFEKISLPFHGTAEAIIGQRKFRRQRTRNSKGTRNSQRRSSGTSHATIALRTCSSFSREREGTRSEPTRSIEEQADHSNRGGANSKTGCSCGGQSRSGAQTTASDLQIPTALSKSRSYALRGK